MRCRIYSEDALKITERQSFTYIQIRFPLRLSSSALFICVTDINCNHFKICFSLYTHSPPSKEEEFQHAETRLEHGRVIFKEEIEHLRPPQLHLLMQGFQLGHTISRIFRSIVGCYMYIIYVCMLVYMLFA